MKRACAAMTMLVAGAMSACSLAPRYTVPASAAPTKNYREIGAWEPAMPGATVDRGPWWSRFGDSELDRLENRVGSANQDLKAAVARLDQARADTRIARAGLFPQVVANASAARARVSENSPRFPAGAQPIGNNFDLEADFSYELDVFGRVRSNLNAAGAALQASAADLATLDLLVHAQLAIDYFTLRSEDAQGALLARTVGDYAGALELTQHLYDAGAAAATDVAQARAQLETARTSAAEIRLERAQTEDAVATLAGENPTAFRLAPHPLTLDEAPPTVDPGLPSTLLERRPDIAAAERRVAAANAEIGVARAAYFPLFNLAAAAGVDSTAAGLWLSAPSRLWSLGAAGALSVFDGGLRRAETARARALHDELVADYRNTVINAYGEVEDSLAALAELEHESASEAAAVGATRTALRQAQYRYRAGAATYLEVALTQTAALQARAAAVTIESRRLIATVRLIEALGGDWRRAPPPAARPPRTAQ